MYQLTKISAAIAAIGLSTVLFMNQSIAATDNANVANKTTASNTSDISPVTNGVSQQVTGKSKTAVSLNKLLPTIKYTTENLPAVAQKINASTWKEGAKIDRNVGTKLQALLNWNQMVLVQ